MEKTFFERFYALDIDTGYIGLEKSSDSEGWYVPKGARVFAALGVDGVMFCFIDGFGETVFALSPETYDNRVCHPLANNFEDFLGLVLACKSADPLEQIYWLDKDRFYHLINVKNEEWHNAEIDAAQESALSAIRSELGVKPITEPYDFVRAVQANFDYSRISYDDEYYETLGLSAPNSDEEHRINENGDIIYNYTQTAVVPIIIKDSHEE